MPEGHSSMSHHGDDDGAGRAQAECERVGDQGTVVENRA